MSRHANFHALVGYSQGREMCSTGQRVDPKESSSLQGRRSSIQEGPFQKECRRRLPYCFQSERKRNSTAPHSKRVAKRTAAAQKASSQAGPTTQPRTGNAPVAPPVAKSSPSSPNKGKSGRGSKHQPKPPPSMSPGQAASAAPSYSGPPTEPDTSTTPALASSLVPANSEGSGRRLRPVLGLASGQFEAALSGAGATKDDNMGEHAVEKEKEEKEKERVPAKDGYSGPRRERPSRRKGRRRERDRPGVLSTPTALHHEAKLALPRASQQAPPTDAISGTLASAGANPPTSTSRRHGRRGGGRGRGGNRGGAPPHADP